MALPAPHSAFLSPALVALAGDCARRRYLEFFAAQIRNPNTRRAYARSVSGFLSWCADLGVTELDKVTPLHVATWIDLQGRMLSVPSVKQALAALRHLFDWLVTGQIMAFNPAASVRGPPYSTRVGKTPVIEAAEVRAVLDSIDVSTPAGLRDRTLIALMVFSFARVGAALAMRVEDVFVQNHRLWVRLHEKGGKQHVMPCHHTLEDYLHAYLDGTKLADEPKGWLFRTIGRGTKKLSERRLAQSDAHAMVRRRAKAAGIDTAIGNHTFRATGVTTYLKNGGSLENAAQMANHTSTRTTQLYDRRQDDISLNEIEKIRV